MNTNGQRGAWAGGERGRIGEDNFKTFWGDGRFQTKCPLA